jgi:hypothetical protein
MNDNKKVSNGSQDLTKGDWMRIAVGFFLMGSCIFGFAADVPRVTRVEVKVVASERISDTNVLVEPNCDANTVRVENNHAAY